MYQPHERIGQFSTITCEIHSSSEQSMSKFKNGTENGRSPEQIQVVKYCLWGDDDPECLLPLKPLQSNQRSEETICSSCTSKVLVKAGIRKTDRIFSEGLVRLAEQYAHTMESCGKIKAMREDAERGILPPDCDTALDSLEKAYLEEAERIRKDPGLERGIELLRIKEERKRRETWVRPESNVTVVLYKNGNEPTQLLIETARKVEKEMPIDPLTDFQNRILGNLPIGGGVISVLALAFAVFKEEIGDGKITINGAANSVRDELPILREKVAKYGLGRIYGKKGGYCYQVPHKNGVTTQAV
ncbi:MAG: hypothetical protein A3D24_03230 [Candidatus Blackburnbacteria bacterium RIFCSPHIGHO2_02_FULL_39_13]|uniref:Uncharacterized protein n=1 Tax=Candidatus Blackburnbacteria bacterium RIFCSPLOWO2_01_FULL_40_20 TaxID=1797519 RepID=A0A1G1VFK8_9BACT|nr:MAG: hypothetical protein A2694_04530 [Candidatus Blackburnbacteria bacterium RIFCSPHIGHO2_01_FULL_40_17]OGY08841.1 MAG: hypothetical protein A3D24_03230 [Candidatus Blackburnbacteria bacterium RIFCSPHIGHO2_02_FULL_39_13]OGY14215.1 MAG: hypothetical protein A3A77_01915 [Candidatus Blackburnbacteria bacterium RIFCSPLOWO2_01_FULL_40_20]